MKTQYNSPTGEEGLEGGIDGNKQRSLVLQLALEAVQSRDFDQSSAIQREIRKKKCCAVCYSKSGIVSFLFLASRSS